MRATSENSLKRPPEWVWRAAQRQPAPALTLLLWLVGLLPVLAQEAFEDTIYTAGTTYSQTVDREWAYIIWDSTTPGMLFNQPFAIYTKSGNAAAATPYTRQSILTVQTDPTVIKVLLSRAVNIGENLGDLDRALRNLFQHLVPPSGLTVEQALAIVIQGSLTDPDNYENLLLLARLHPGVAMCLGTAYAGLISNSGPTTFEVRQFDVANSKDLGVIGRVTVTAKAPLVLPSPGPPVAVPETDNKGNPKPSSAKGNLNVKLRWATPAELRRLSIINYGFNVYRYSKAIAELKNYQLTPPSPAVLAADLAAGLATRINELPIVTENDFDPADPVNPTANTNDVANFNQALGGDSTTYFVADDNGGNRPGGVKFQNGEQFYYFVSARDVLGRDGLVSLGTLVTMCDRLPPPAPAGVRVESEDVYDSAAGVSEQHLKIVWPPYQGTNDTVLGYYVYRWRNPAEVQKPSARATNNAASPFIPNAANQSELSFVDDGVTAPQMPQDAGLAFWYTVRAVDNSACGGNVSPDSAPVFGVLRDRQGPPAPSGRVLIQCVHPAVDFVSALPLAWQDPDPTVAAYQLACTRDGLGGEEIQWADFFVSMLPFSSQGHPTVTNLITRVYFPAAYTPGEMVNTPLLIDRTNFPVQNLYFLCRVGTRHGRISNLALFSSATPPGTNDFLGVLFHSTLVTTRAENCEAHTPVAPGTNKITGIEICANVTSGAKEFRLYRRIGDSRLTLLKQGKIEGTPVCHTDLDLPSSSGTICYYVQFLDEHGNASPLKQLGECMPVSGLGKLPKPLLGEIQPAGTEANPRMVLRWFCPPAGIERFRVYVAQEFGQPPEQLGSEMSSNIFAADSPPTSDEQFTLDGMKTNMLCKAYYTLPLGPAFGDGASFEVNLPGITLGAQYTVFVRAVDKAANLSDPSNGKNFKWSVYKQALPQVPWPARDLPEVFGFNSNLVAQVMPAIAFKGLGVRIGEMPCIGVTPTNGTLELCLPVPENPARRLYTNEKGEFLLPLVLYRIQVANGFFPSVSHDVIQVSPMMERIAYRVEYDSLGHAYTHIYDPFIRFLPPDSRGRIALFLVDTQPVVRGSRYRYLLVRFDPKTREPVQVIPTNEVDVP